MNTRFEAFVEVVADMRAAQREYFRLRRERLGPEEWGPALKHMQAMERAVDQWLAHFEQAQLSGQASMFDAEE